MRARKSLAVIVFAVLAAMLALASWRESPLTWGAHAYAFLPWVARAAAVALLAACVLPAGAGRAGAIVMAAGRATGSMPRVLVIAAVCGVAFYGLRIRYQFLGDGQLWVDLIAQGRDFHHFEPFASTAVRFVAAAFSPQAPGAAAGTLSIILGVAFVVLAAWLCRAAWRDRDTQGLAWLLLLAHPTLLLFFGYVESYPLVQVLQAGFALACVRALGGRLPLVVPALLLGVAVASHLLAATWAAALGVVALARAGRSARGRGIGAAAALAGIGLGAGVLLMLGVGASLQEIVALLRGERGIRGIDLGWVFSWQHAVDVANEFFLIAAPALVVASGAIASGASLRKAWQDDRTKLYAALGLGPALALLAVPPLIGGARDWDLHAALALPMILLATQLWSQLGAGAPRAAAGRSVVFALVTVAGWLAVNLNTTTAARRFEVVQQPSGTFTPWARAHAAETMAVYYRDTDPERELQAWTRAAADNPRNPRYTTSVGNVAVKLGRLDLACPMFQRSLELGMREFHIVHNLALCGIQTGQPAEAERYATLLMEAWPENWRGAGLRAQARLQLGRAGEALDDVQRALQQAPREAELHFQRAVALRALGRVEEARQAAEQALRLDPRHAGARKLLAAM